MSRYTRYVSKANLTHLFPHDSILSCSDGSHSRHSNSEYEPASIWHFSRVTQIGTAHHQRPAEDQRDLRHLQRARGYLAEVRLKKMMSRSDNITYRKAQPKQKSQLGLWATCTSVSLVCSYFELARIQSTTRHARKKVQWYLSVSLVTTEICLPNVKIY